MHGSHGAVAYEESFGAKAENKHKAKPPPEQSRVCMARLYVGSEDTRAGGKASLGFPRLEHLPPRNGPRGDHIRGRGGRELLVLSQLPCYFGPRCPLAAYLGRWRGPKGSKLIFCATQADRELMVTSIAGSYRCISSLDISQVSSILFWYILTSTWKTGTFHRENS